MASRQIVPMVVDLSHHDTLDDLQAAKDYGIRGIIYKCTEGASYVDPTYQEARKKAAAVGFLWGAYHFFRPGDVRTQVLHFLKHAEADENTLLALDHEDAGCSGADVETFLRIAEALAGRKIALYSGNLIKEQLGNQVSTYLGSCRLWLAQYGATPTVQASWADWWLWQYTGDGEGPLPHKVPGIGPGAIDVNSYAGTMEQLEAEWSGKAAAAYEPPAADVTRWGQATLNLLGRTPRLQVDGSYGNKTREAVAKYQVDNDLRVSGLLDKETIEDMTDEVVKWNDRRTK